MDKEGRGPPGKVAYRQSADRERYISYEVNQPITTAAIGSMAQKEKGI
jgi:hypothetical protein